MTSRFLSYQKKIIFYLKQIENMAILMVRGKSTPSDIFCKYIEIFKSNSGFEREFGKGYNFIFVKILFFVSSLTFKNIGQKLSYIIFSRD